MIKRVWRWLLGVEDATQASPRLIDLVKQQDTSAHGGFVRLNNDLSHFVDDYKEKDPLIMMAYAYARRIAAAGMFFQGIAGKDLFDYVYDIFKKWQIATGVSVDFQEQAGAQGMELALKYLPEMDRDSIRLMTGLAAQGVNAFGSQPSPSISENHFLTVKECVLMLSKAKELTGSPDASESSSTGGSENEDYLYRVAGLLTDSLGKNLPLKSAYALASECLTELREKIAKGIFYEGENPRESFMAYYSLCSMLDEVVAESDRELVTRVFFSAKILKGDVESEEGLSYLEKGIVEFGSQVLSINPFAYSKNDVVSVKRNAENIILFLMAEGGGNVCERDVSEIVNNVTARVGEKEATKVGSEILALSVMSNAVGYYIDQSDLVTAKAYFKCIELGLKKYIEGFEESFDAHQHGALEMVMQGYRALSDELMTTSRL